MADLFVEFVEGFLTMDKGSGQDSVEARVRIRNDSSRKVFVDVTVEILSRMRIVDQYGESNIPLEPGEEKIIPITIYGDVLDPGEYKMHLVVTDRETFDVYEDEGDLIVSARRRFF